MKKASFSFLMIVLGLSLYAQSPEKMSFQAVIRNASNNLVVSDPVGMQVSILQGTPLGAAVYVETHAGATNANGLFTIQVGNGLVMSGNFNTIDWANGPYFIKTETDPTGGTNYTITATTQLLSVPYALYAKKAGNIPADVSAFNNDAGYISSETDGSVTNELQTLFINGDTISLTNGGSVVIPASTDAQILSISGDSLSISNGNSIPLNTFSDPLSFIEDTDHDTRVIAEQNPDEDIIRFYINGNEKWIMVDNRLENNSSNIAIGSQTLLNNVSPGNIAIGSLALQNSTTAIGNIAIGYNSMQNNTTGDGNTAVGYQTLKFNTTGYNNTTLGRYSLYSNTIGHDNIALGDYALSLNTSGSYNTAIGEGVLENNTSAFFNTALGVLALHENTVGHENTALGAYALKNNTTGNQNIAIGYGTLDANTIASDNLAIGHNTLGSNISGSHNIGLGNFALNGNTTGAENLAIGYNTLQANNSNFNIAIGNYSMLANTTGNHNLAIGCNAMSNLTSGSLNIVIGNNAMDQTVTAVDNNVVIGVDNMGEAAGGNSCVSVGSQSLYFNNGDFNVCVGFGTLPLNTTGNNNTALGSLSMSDNITGTHNVAIGSNALTLIPGGSSNTAVGAASFQTVSNFNNSTALGYNTSITASNQVRVGNASVTSIGGQVGWTTVSDARFKKNIEENVSGLDFIMKLRPVTYNLDANAIATFYGTPDSLRDFESESIKTSQVQTGFIAQEVEQAAIESNFNFSGVDAPKNAGDFYGLRYAEFTVPLVKAVQEQQKQIEELKKTNTILQQENEQTKIELQKIKLMLEQINPQTVGK